MSKPTKWHMRPAKTQVSLGKCFFGMVQLISKEKVCHFIAKSGMLRDMHDVSFMLSYAIFDVVNLQKD